MKIAIDETGLPDGPLLVVVPGLLGGPEDFAQILPAWSAVARVLLVDLNPSRRASGGLTGISQNDMLEVVYDETSSEIEEVLRTRYPGRSAAFVGVSLGGKVVYDFASRFPEKFLGGLVTDISPGPLEATELYAFVNEVVPGLNIHQPWSALKEEIKQKIPDRYCRVLVQSQVTYADPLKGPGRWRPGMDGLRELLASQGINDQWEPVERASAHPALQGKALVVLTADTLSGIPREDLPRLRQIPWLKLEAVSGANHFMHVSHRALLEMRVVKLIQTLSH